MTLRFITFILLLTLVLAACGTQSTPEPTTEPQPEPTQPAEASAAEAEETPELSDIAQAGQVVFEQFYEEVGFACVTCHYINSDNRLLGPGLLSIEDRFEDYDVETDDLEMYILESIVAPRDFNVPAESPYPENIMPDTYGEFLSEEDLDALVAYILAF